MCDEISGFHKDMHYEKVHKTLHLSPCFESLKPTFLKLPEFVVLIFLEDELW